MKIVEGNVYKDKAGNMTILPNKTRKYILPCIKHYGQTFLNKLNSVFKVACGLGINSYQPGNLYILLNSKIANKHFLKFLDWIREQPYYTDDFVYGNISKSSYHMIVVKIPPIFEDSVENFIAGKYSKMYSTDIIEKYFNDNIEVKHILLKDDKYKKKFIDKLNSEFGSNIKDFKDEDYELDFPINLKDEIFEI